MALAVAVRDQLRNESAPRAPSMPERWRSAFSTDDGRNPPGPQRRELACKAGCTYCCHNVVMATAPEIFLAVSEFRARASRRLRRRGGGQVRCGRHHRRDQAEPLPPAARQPVLRLFGTAERVPQAQLVLRRGLHRRLRGERRRDPHRRFDQEIFECCAVALLVGMRLWDERQGSVFELSGALRVALQDPQAEQKWLAGEAVFAGVASQSKLPGIDEHAAFLWGRFVGGPVGWVSAQRVTQQDSAQQQNVGLRASR